MAGIAKEWNMYQVSKALLRRDQQNALTAIEGHMKRVPRWSRLAELEISNEYVNEWRDGEYTPAENELFLNELAKVNLYAKDKCTVQNPFDSVKLALVRGEKRFSIRFSDYFSKVIGRYIRDNQGEQDDQH